MKKIVALLIVLALIAALPIQYVFAAEEAEKTIATDLEREIADWGEPVTGVTGQEIYKLDFEGMEGNFAEIEELQEHWYPQNATQDYISKVETKSKYGTYLHMNPFSQMPFNYAITNKYVASVDMKIDEAQGAGFIFRCTDELFLNPYYEDDGGGQNILSIAGAGIVIIPHGKKTRISVKVYDERKEKLLNSKITLFDNPDGISFTSSFHTVTVVDYISGAKIFEDGKLLCSLEFSDPTTYEDYGSEYSFYNKCVLKKPDGSVAAEIGNSLVCSEISSLAFGVRINDMCIDNITLAEYAIPTDSISVSAAPRTTFNMNEELSLSGWKLLVKYSDGTEKEVQITSDMVTGYDSSSAGEKELTITYSGKTCTQKISVEEPLPAATDAPAAEPQATSEPTKASENAAESDSNGKVLTVGIIVGAVIIVAIVVVVIILKKKSK